MSAYNYSEEGMISIVRPSNFKKEAEWDLKSFSDALRQLPTWCKNIRDDLYTLAPNSDPLEALRIEFEKQIERNDREGEQEPHGDFSIRRSSPRSHLGFLGKSLHVGTAPPRVLIKRQKRSTIIDAETKTPGSLNKAQFVDLDVSILPVTVLGAWSHNQTDILVVADCLDRQVRRP